MLDRLTSSWEQLGSLVDEGLLSYPYSTRELVSVTKHLQNFPKDRYACCAPLAGSHLGAHSLLLHAALCMPCPMSWPLMRESPNS